MAYSSTQLTRKRSNGNRMCSCRKSLRQRRRLDNLLVIFERRRFPIRVLVVLTDAFHDGNGRVFCRRAFLTTVWKAVDLVIGVATEEERYRVTLLATLVDHSVEVADVAIIRPDRVSSPTFDGILFYVETYHLMNMLPRLTTYAPLTGATSSHSSILFSQTCSPSTSSCMSRVTEPKSV